MTTQSHNSSGQSGLQSEVVEELKHDAERLTGDVKARAKQEAESRKGQAAHVAGSASSALDAAARDLRENPEAPDWMASALQQAARSIDGLASHVEGRSIDQLGQEVSDFARRNPGTFLAASVAAGFAASRVLRAGIERKRHDQADNHGAGSLSGDDHDWPADEGTRPAANGNFATDHTAGGAGMGGTTQ